jgi:hypothetical protein
MSVACARALTLIETRIIALQCESKELQWFRRMPSLCACRITVNGTGKVLRFIVSF